MLCEASVCGASVSSVGMVYNKVSLNQVQVEEGSHIEAPKTGLQVPARLGLLSHSRRELAPQVCKTGTGCRLWQLREQTDTIFLRTMIHKNMGVLTRSDTPPCPDALKASTESFNSPDCEELNTS